MKRKASEERTNLIKKQCRIFRTMVLAGACCLALTACSAKGGGEQGTTGGVTTAPPDNEENENVVTQQPDNDGKGNVVTRQPDETSSLQIKSLSFSGTEAVIYQTGLPVLTFTVDTEGNLYTLGYDSGEASGYWLRQYDAEQKLLMDYWFDSSLSSISAIAVEGRTAYLTANRIIENRVFMALYAMNLDTKNIEVLADFPQYDTIQQLILQEGRLYLLGNRRFTAEEERPSGGGGYGFYEDQITCYQLENGESSSVPIEYPINMAAMENGGLMVHAYVKGKGYQLLKYDTEKNSVSTAAEFTDYYVQQFAVCHDGKDLLYNYNRNSRGLVLAPLNKLHQETELCPEEYVGMSMNNSILYQDGKVYMLNFDRDLMCFALADTVRENKTLRYISSGYQREAPDGLGYSMERKEMLPDKFALKVLAQDRDFDLCMIDSIDEMGSNIRKTGVFYPLDDVPGVKEYLEKCHPYVREAVTKEDGSIWALPVAVNIPGLIVHEGTLAELGVPLKRDITWEEFLPMFAALPEEQKKLTSINLIVSTIAFSQQYFQRYESVDNEIFRRTAELMKLLDPNQGLNSIEDSERYLFDYERNMSTYIDDWWIPNYNGQNARLYPMPKLSAEDPNVGSCVMLAINPNSDRLKETLAFMEDYTAWLMKKGRPFFTGLSAEEGTFKADLYDLYENAEISFGLETNIYLDDYYDMLAGRISMEEYIKDTDRKLRIYFGE